MASDTATQAFTVRLPADLNLRVDERAGELGLTKVDVVRLALRHYLTTRSNP